MTNIPPPFSSDELKDACEQFFAETDQTYPGLGKMLAETAEEEYPTIDASVYIPAKIIMVEDGPDTLRKYTPHFVAAARRRFGIIFHSITFDSAYEKEDMAKLILDEYPTDIICMDGKLENGIYGDSIVRILKEQRADIRCIGFSSSDNLNRHIINAGALGAVYKREAPRKSIQELAALVNRLCNAA